jgi:tetratricopeptide (TPR) repeat protein
VILERLGAGEDVPEKDRQRSADLLVTLAEAYDGEHGLAYSAGALDIQAGHDRALQLYAHYANELGRNEDLSTRYLAYVRANPGGTMADDARWLLAASYEGAGQPEPAIELLEPLRAKGDTEATKKLSELYAQSGVPMPAASPAQPPAPKPIASKPPPKPARSEPPPAPVRDGAGRQLEALLDDAQEAANNGDNPKAYARYKEVLASDAAHPEALSWVEDYLRTKRDYPALRDVLLTAVRAPGQSLEARRDRLREVAGLCESNIRDNDGAIAAYKQLLSLDRTDESARQALSRLLEKTHRWDDLANLLEQEAAAEPDIEKKIVLEKKVAALHDGKRKDLASAGEAWARIANLTPDDDGAATTAATMFEKAGALDRAAQVIAEAASALSDSGARGAMLERLGAVREKMKDLAGAGDAYAEAAEQTQSHRAWEAAERCFVAAEAWDKAGNAAFRLAELNDLGPKAGAKHFARAAAHYERAQDGTSTVAFLERAAALDPANDNYAAKLEERHTAAGRWTDLAAMFTRRAEAVEDKAARVETRKKLARLQASQLGDKDAAREAWQKVLDDENDKEALERLLDDAVERTDPADATALLRKLEAVSTDPQERVQLALREAEMLADEVGDVQTAISRYERILAELEPTCRPALQAIADLEEAAENLPAATNALDRELALVEDAAQRAPIATRLARLYEQIGDVKKAIVALDQVRKADPEDFDALTRLGELCERQEDWPRVADLLAQRIEVEADEAEVSILTKRLSRILADRLNRGDEALAVLNELAEQGEPSVRAAYIELGDRLGWTGVVAEKIVSWWLPAKSSEERTRYLRGAFDRFLEVGRNPEAVKLAGELAKIKGGADRELAKKLEALATKSSDLDALTVAHDLLIRDLAGPDRAEELVRQAEVRAAAGAPKLEALQHGEGGLSSVSPSETEPLLARLAAVSPDAGEIVGLYERQVSRCKAPADRVVALARAAQVASEHAMPDKAKALFELAITGTPTEETLGVVEHAAREGDARAGRDVLRRALASAMAAGGQGARDGGRTRGALMRRAAAMVSGELSDPDQAFSWLGDALIAHVEPATLDAVEELARHLGEPQRAEGTLARALGEVFDGPLVRQLLARRARLRREDLADKPGAAADLKKLHDLSPSDQAVNDELSALLKELGDYRGMVQLYEDQILRGKDMNARADLARRVARMWEEELADPREAADAWRRVLRMKQGDPEATAGLERAKANMLKPEGERRSVRPSPPAESATASAPPPAPEPASAAPAPAPATEGHDAPAPEPVPEKSEKSDADEKTPIPSALPTAVAAEIKEGHERPARPSGLEFAPSDEVTNEMLPGAHVGHDTAPFLDGSTEPTGSHAEPQPAGAVQDTTPPYGTSASMVAASAAGDDEVLIADDLAEVVDVEEPVVEPVEPEEEEPLKPKRSVPPPVPRG